MACLMTKDTDSKTEQLDLLLQRLDNSGLTEYLKLSRKTGKILWLNFLSGVARGLGFTIGTTLVLAVAYKILTHIISMNIPYITESLRKFLEVISP